MIARRGAAVFTIVGGGVHLQQWWRVFRHLDIGPTFIVNVVLSVVLGGLLLMVVDRRVDVAALVLAVGSLLAIIASRTVGFLDFEATGFEAPEIIAIVVEAGAALALIAALVAPATGVRSADA